MSITATIFFLCFLAGLGLCVVRHPIFGLYTYLAVFYLDAPSRWWGADLPDLRWSFMAAALTLICALFRARNRWSWLTHAPIALFVVYAAWMWVQTPWALDPAEHANGRTLFSKYCLVIAMVYMLLNNYRDIRNFMVANALGGMYLGYVALSSYSGGRLDGVGGPGISDANSLGMHLAAVVFMIGGVFLGKNGRMRLVVALTAPLILNTIVMAGSRGAFLAFVCGGLTFLLFRPKKQSMRAAGYAAVGLAAFLAVAGDYFWERMSTITEAASGSAEIDKSAASRLVIINAQLEIFKAHPLGGGHRTTTVLSEQFIPIEYHASQGGRSSHNTFMSALVDQGFPGFILWTLIAWNLYRYASQARRIFDNEGQTDWSWLNAGAAAAIVVVLVAGMFAPFIRAEMYVWLIAVQSRLITIAKTLAFQRATNAKEAAKPIQHTTHNTRV